MAVPSRHSGDSVVPAHERTFFATTKAHMGRHLFQSERNAFLLVEVLRACVIEKRFKLHDFVVMPNHLHLLLTVDEEMSIEKAMQFVKGRFSIRLKREFGYLGEVWQRGFSERRADSYGEFGACRRYIAENPVKAGLVEKPEDYPYCLSALAARKAKQGLKPASI